MIKKWLAIVPAIILMLFLLASMTGTLNAQDEGDVQSIKGVIRPGDTYWYTLPDLKKGQLLTASMEGTSGNLDPIMALVDDSDLAASIGIGYENMIEEAVADGSDPMIALTKAADNFFLVWDDDGGEGLAAQFTYDIPEDGDYQLIITDALTEFGQSTTGDFELLIGLDAPQVLTGEAVPNSDSIAILNREASASGIAVEEVQGTIKSDDSIEIIDLYDVSPGDTIFIYIEALSGDLKPSLVLMNYADKLVSAANIAGLDSEASLTYTVDDKGSGFAVLIEGCCEDAPTTGDYRLLVGINAPEVLSGEAVHSDETIIKEPIPVALGVKLQQIIEVNEQNEFFTAAASLQMEWDDPALAFSPDECDCTFKTYTEQNFSEFISENGGRWPDFTLYNQQGNRWTQNRNVVVQQDGHALYFERFTTNLQVDFDFRQYPFDEEEFIIRVDSIFPDTFYYFTDLEGFSEISPEHGEDEFMIDNFKTTISSEQASTKSEISRFTFTFGGPRHMIYYVLQIFVPIILILGVLWVTFFLRDYALRVEVASANLLVFIAFSFSLADNYPHLGYVTLLDVVMLIAFVISALVIVYNVYLRRLELAGKEELANKIDNVLDWIYPISIVVSGIVLYIIFFLVQK